ncbi:hypothetical protein HQ865_07275 [Mucilaginibacter mali]|uniref:Uncharacterized protein n=1 Tax=Mucilaginibacter mali TaxID=2740462 RepID=A0A7D4UNZ9_9SPHI|nr:hypothetical protein [Mucilaginibacter mali]QKJ29560.1 hypothetical protein HQ865_07275 [Mucilaginibacter mali]
MKKVLLSVMVVFFILPLSSFKSDYVLAKNFQIKELKKQTDPFIGEFYYAPTGQNYYVYGDSAGNVTYLEDDNGPVTTFFGTWGTDYGLSHDCLGVWLFIGVGPGYIYNDILYQ